MVDSAPSRPDRYGEVAGSVMGISLALAVAVQGGYRLTRWFVGLRRGPRGSGRGMDEMDTVDTMDGAG